jgi:hypothetical protein
VRARTTKTPLLPQQVRQRVNATALPRARTLQQREPIAADPASPAAIPKQLGVADSPTSST